MNYANQGYNNNNWNNFMNLINSFFNDGINVDDLYSISNPLNDSKI